MTAMVSSCNSKYLGLRPATHLSSSSALLLLRKQTRCYNNGHQEGKPYRRLVVLAVTEGSAKSSESEEQIPSWARPDSDEPPPWARDDGGKGSSQTATVEIPYYAYLLASAVTAIAAVCLLYLVILTYHSLLFCNVYTEAFATLQIGSVFEYANQRPVFGVVNSDSIFYAPLLGFFVFTGIPTSAFLWFKAVQIANAEAEEQDRKDGFL